jgi:hypothetical protein
VSGRDDLDTLRDAFSTVFACGPKEFGGASPGYSGFHDGAQGVQWNVIFEAATLRLHLGVNLEGLRYGGAWPVSRFIRAELRSARLFENITQLSQPAEIGLLWFRDAWQVTTRLSIQEGTIAHQTLGSLTQSDWERVLREALSCLNAAAGYNGRAKQTVTRQNGTRVLMEVSPHLQFRWPMRGAALHDRDALISALRLGRERMQPLYDFAVARSR